MAAGLVGVVIGALGLMFPSQPVAAATGINKAINFQGKMVANPNGTNIPNGTYNMEFKLYTGGNGCVGGGTSPCGGTLQWTEDWLRNNSQGVTITDGVFQVNLGSISALPAVFNNDTIWLSMNLGSINATCTPFSSCTGDGEMLPFIRFTAAPYALNSDLLDGLDSTAFAQLAATNTFTAANLFAPTAASTVALTVKATTAGSTNSLEVFDSGGVRQAFFDASGALTLSKAITAPTSTNTINSLVINAGALSGVTGYAQASGAFLQSGTGTFGTGTGAVSLNGDTTVAANKNLILPSGTGTFQQTFSSGVASSAQSIGLTNSNTSAGVAIQGVDLTPTNTATPSSGTNTLNIVNFNAGGALGANDATNGLNFASATGYTNFLKTPTAVLSSAGALTGLTGVTLASGNINAGTGTITSGAINSQTISSAANFTGTVTIQGANSLTLGTSSNLGSLIFRDGSSAFKGTVKTNTLTADQTYLLTNGGTICTDSGNCAGAGATLQSSYNFSAAGTTPEIKLDNVRSNGTLDIQDADTTLGAAVNLLAIRGSNSSGLGTLLFGVQGGGNATLQGTLNGQTISSAASFTGTVTAATSFIAPLLQTADVTGASTALTVRSGNSTTSGNTGAVSITTGNAASGNSGALSLDTGTATGGTAGGITLGGTNASALTLGRSGFGVTVPGTMTIQGGTNSLTLGTGNTAGGTGALVFKNASNTNNLTLQSGVTGGTGLSLTLPTADGNSLDCLKTNGSGVLTFSGCLGGGGGGVTSLNSLQGILTLQGTTNQINVASGGTTVTLSTPQDINTTSSPTFAGVTAPLFQTADVTGASAALTVRSGNSTTSGNTGAVTIASGNATSGNSGAVSLDSGTASGGTAGGVNVGTGAFAHTTTVGSASGTSVLLLQGGTGTGVNAAIRLSPADAGDINIGTTTETGQIVVGQSTGTNTISIGTANRTSATQTITIGNGTSATSGGVAVNIANGIPGASTTNTVAIGTGGTTTGTVGITIGSSGAAAHTTVIQGGNGTGASAAIRLSPANAGDINIGTTTETGQIVVGQSTGTNTVSIGTANRTSATQTINIGNGTSATSGGVSVAIANGVPGASTTNTVAIGTGGTTTGTVGITIGSGGAAAHTTVIQGGNGTGASAAIRLSPANAGDINIGTTTETGQIRVGQSTGTNTISIGTANRTSATQTVDIAGGTSATSGGTSVTIANGIPGASTTNTVAIGTGGTTTGTVGITIGSSGAAAHTTTIQGGNGTGAVAINTASGGTLNVGSSGVANTVQIGNTTGAVTQNIFIGNNATGSSVTNTTIGSTVGSSTLTLQAGSGNIVLGSGTIKRTATGNTVIDLSDAGTTKLTVTNSGGGAAVVSAGTGFQINGGSAAAGHYLRGDGTNYVDGTIQASDLPDLSSTYIKNGVGLQTSGNFYIQSVGDNNVTAAIKVRATQNSDALQVQDSSGNPIAGIETTGAFYSAPSGTSIPATARIFAQPLSAGSTAIIARAAASATGDIFDAQDSTGANTMFAIGPTGQVTIKPTGSSTAALAVQNASATVLNVDAANQLVTLQQKTDVATLSATNLFSGGSCSGTNWSGTGPWTHTAGSAVALSCTPPASVTIGATYQVTFVTSSVTAGNVTPNLGGVAGSILDATTTGTETEVFTATGTANLTFVPSSSFAGAVNTITIKQITNAGSTLTVNNSSSVASLEVRANGGAARTTAVGLNALQSNISGTDLAAFGSGALKSNTTGVQSAAFGSASLIQNTTGSWNSALGYGTLNSNTSGHDNAAVGWEALAFNSIGAQNTAIGSAALLNNTSASNNTAVGFSALNLAVTGSQNSAVGSNSLASVVTGTDNTAQGFFALNQTTGSLNTGLGDFAGRQNTTGSNNTSVGAWAGDFDNDNFFTSNNNSSTALGYSAIVQASNALVLGGAGNQAVNVGIGTSNPDNVLSVAPFQYNSGSSVTGTQSTTTVTASSGTPFTSAMIGNEIVWGKGGTKETITALPSGTSPNSQAIVSVSQTISPGQSFRVHYLGLQVTSTGKVGVGTTAPTANFQVSTPVNSASAFQVQNQGGTALLNVDTSSNKVTVTGAPLVTAGIASPAAPTLATATTTGTLPNGVTYLYKLAAIAGDGSLTTAVASSPTSVTTSGSNTSKNTLTWSAITNATGGYAIYRSINGGTNWFKNTVATGTTTLVDNGTNFTWATAANPPLTNYTSGVTTASDSLTLQQTGDVFGTTGLSLQNRGGSAGALFTNGGLGLVDFGFVGTDSGVTTKQGNLRYEARSGSIIGAGNTSGELEWLDDATGSFSIPFVTGKNTTAVRATSATALLVQTANGAATFLTADTLNSVLKVGTTATPTLSQTTLFASYGEIANTLRVGTSSNGFDFNPTTGPNYSGTARPTKRISLSPEYPGATMTAQSGCGSCSGSMSSDAEPAAGVANLSSAEGYAHNFYSWTTTQASNQNYDVWVSMTLPADFSAFASSNPMFVWTKTTNTTNGTVTAQIFDAVRSPAFCYGGASDSAASLTPTSANTWQEKQPGDPTASGCSFAANDRIQIRFRMQAPQSGVTKLGELRFDYLAKF